MTNESPVAEESRCFGDKCKECCAWYLYIVSFLMFVLSIVMGAYGYVQINGTEIKTPAVGDYAAAQNFKIPSNMAAAYILIVGALFAFTVSFFGFCTQRCKVWYCSCPLAILSLLAGLLGIVGGIMVFSGDVSGYLNTEFCGVSSAAIQKQYNSFVDAKMCTADCPCLTPSTAVQSAFTTRLGQVPRTAVLTYKTADQGGFTSYQACYNALAKTQTGNDANEFFKKGGFGFLKSFEDQLDCASFCAVPLFYLTKPISQGPPPMACNTAIINKVAGNGAVGGISLGVGFILLTMFGAAIPLCTGLAADGDLMGE